MATIFDILAERRIADAVEQGDLDNLPGSGRPLDLDDDLLVSPEQRMVNRVLKNAGFTPREILLRKEISALRQEIEATPPGERRAALRRELMLLLVQVSGKG
ncbi:DnaJ family domain-containing protein [Rhodocyclus tenuis]|uniref:DnaJ homologue subfamily C member 28 conserved domain-containing protein n=1 Tax=Rhodocyclus tenuis TaxID=1066 RepID=A0A840G663_RHOTE|nr:DUF1992 domain-containing protein [Rhodocyclus tenuis]MBB4246218.1 hypothetical protein [Rhodocyclus tenuis]